MIRFSYLASGIITTLFLSSCSQVLEPVSFFGDEQDIALSAAQEEFKINVESLTFDTAQKANKSPYLRRLILNGTGSKANIINEATFLKSSFPKSSSNPNYLLGIGDELLFTQLSEFENGTPNWPIVSKKPKYLLGAGDELTFMQSNDSMQKVSINANGTARLDESDKLILTKGTIGSNGNILLFGLGNIQAANRTIDDVRTEVRNILIRNGLAPNFQLEISDFKSQKVFVTPGINEERIIYLTNLPFTLKELALSAGLSETDENFAIVKLIRSDQVFRFTASQLLDSTASKIILQNNDQIEIRIASQKSNTNVSVVGSKGNILIEKIGKISAVNRTLDDLYKEISGILTQKGIVPNFQLKISKFVSKKAYLTQDKIGNVAIPLTDSNMTLRELILSYKEIKASKTALSIITLKRNGQEFRMTEDQVLDPKAKDIWIFDNDQIEIKHLDYKPGQVFALSGAGNAKVVAIHPSKRETLADILFAAGGAYDNLSARRSEIYLLRGQNPSVAYHLDAQNVSRILVAAKTELRPNDIVYVADRPIISFSRTLSELSPLRSLLRDIKNDKIP